MKKYKLKLSNNLSFNIALPDKQNWPDSTNHLIYRLISGVGLVALAGLLIVAFINAFNNSINQAGSLNLYLLVSVASLLILLWVWRVFSTGWKQIIDPPALLGILVFALVVIINLILGPLALMGADGADMVTARRLNTFGTAGIKFLSGVAVIGLVALFYTINVFMDKRHKVQKFAKGFFGVLLAAGVWIVAIQPQEYPQLGLVVAIGMLVSLVSAIWSRRDQVRLVMSILFLVLTLGLLVQPANTWQIFLAALISLTVWAWCYLFVQGFRIRLDIGGFINSVKQVADRQISPYKLWSHKSVLFIGGGIVMTLAFIISLLTDQPSATDTISILFGYVGELFRSIQNFGVGSIWSGINVSATSIGLSPQTAFLKILTYQGIIGILAYLFLVGLSLYISVTQLKRELDKPQLSRFTIPALMILVFVPIAGLLVDMSVLVVVVWWLALAVVTTNEFQLTRQKVSLINSFSIGKLDLSSAIPYLRVALLLGLLVIWGLLNNGLLSLLAEGTI